MKKPTSLAAPGCILFAFTVVALYLTACGGTPSPSPERPAHHTDNGFRNPPGSPVREAGFRDFAGFFWRSVTSSGDFQIPEGHLAVESEALAGLAAAGDPDGGSDSLTWLGHASFLVRLGGVMVLTDPFLTSRVSPFGGAGPERFAPPAISIENLPPLDVVVVSHNHYDHMDMRTIGALKDKQRITAVVPLGMGGYFRDAGYAKVQELDWHQSTEVNGLTITVVPAVHFSRRGLFDQNRVLWAGYVLDSGGEGLPGRRVYFAGDTGYSPVFAGMGARYGPVDAALLPIGAYEPRKIMRAVHVNPEEAVQLGRDMGAKNLVAMHWGTIRLTEEPPFEPPERFVAAARAAGFSDDQVWVMGLGETRVLP